MANPYGPYSTSNMLGANFEQTYPAEGTDPYHAPPPFALGQSALGTDNSTWVFVQSDVVVAAGVTVATVSADFHITAATGGTYTTAAAFAINDYGWVKKTTSPL